MPRKKGDPKSPRSPTNDDVRMGRRLKTRRLEIKMSQQALADAIGVSAQQVQKYEQGRNRLSGSRLPLVAKALGMDVRKLIGGDHTSPRARIIEEFLASKEGFELARNFVDLSLEQRRAVLKLLRTMPR